MLTPYFWFALYNIEFVLTDRRGADPYGVTLFKFFFTGRRGADPYGVALFDFVFEIALVCKIKRLRRSLFYE